MLKNGVFQICVVQDSFKALHYVFIPLLFNTDPFGTCVNSRMNSSISTEEDAALSSIKNFNVGVSSPKRPRNNGKKIESITKGAIVMMMYLVFETSSSV
jgi:hypothetical protein